MVSKVETSVKSSTSKSVVKSIRSVFSKKSKSKNEASNVTAVEDELVKESMILENVDEARDMPESHKSDPIDASQIEELQKIVKNAESTISKAQDEELASKRSNKSVRSHLCHKDEESSPVSDLSPMTSPIAEDAEVITEKSSSEVTDEKSPTIKEEQAENDKEEEKADDTGKEVVKESVAAAVSEDIPSPTTTSNSATEEVAKPGFFCFSCQ